MVHFVYLKNRARCVAHVIGQLNFILISFYCLKFQLPLVHRQIMRNADALKDK